jgi:hypothetical protein
VPSSLRSPPGLCANGKPDLGRARLSGRRIGEERTVALGPAGGIPHRPPLLGEDQSRSRRRRRWHLPIVT